jgi:hypothetical protein
MATKRDFFSASFSWLFLIDLKPFMDITIISKFDYKILLFFSSLHKKTLKNFITKGSMTIHSEYRKICEFIQRLNKPKLSERSLKFQERKKDALSFAYN